MASYARAVCKREIRPGGVSVDGKQFGSAGPELVIDYLECGHVAVSGRAQPVRTCKDCSFAADSRAKRRA